MSVIIALSVTVSDATAAQPAESGQFDDTVMAALLGLQLEFVRVLLTRLKAACRVDLLLPSPLTHIGYEQALKNAVTRTRLAALQISRHDLSGIEQRGQWPQTQCDALKKLANSLGK